MNPQQLVDLIKSCKSELFGIDNLKTFLKIIPIEDELSLVNSYSGDISKLGPPEQLYLQLSQFPNYKCYLDGMLLKEEFPSLLKELTCQLDIYIKTNETILNSNSLKNFLHLTLTTGNFINTGSYAGNAAGFRLSTLTKLIDTRANKPKVTLLHVLVEMAEQMQCLNFINDLNSLQECSRLSVDGLKAEMLQITKSISQLENQLKQPETKVLFLDFVEKSKASLETVKAKFETLNYLSQKLSEYFSEDESKFNLEESITILYQFWNRVKQSLDENKQMKKLEEKYKIKNQQISSKKEKKNLDSPEEECVIEKLLADIKKGNFKLKRIE